MLAESAARSTRSGPGDRRRAGGDRVPGHAEAGPGAVRAGGWPRPRHHPADHDRNRRAAPDPRLGALHPGPDPGAGLGDARHHRRRAADRQHRRGRRDHQVVHAALQLPAVLDRRSEDDARHQPPGDRPRRAGRAGAAAAAAALRRLPLHPAGRLRDPGVERLVLDGHGLRRLAGADGCGRADEGALRRRRDGADQGRRQGRHPDRHPRLRGPPRRHGLQGGRHREGHHLDPDGHQDRGPRAQDHGAGAGAGPEGPAPHPQGDGQGAAGAPDRAVASTRRASSPCRSSPTRSAT